jgi:predicted amidohydrolase YtcJ
MDTAQSKPSSDDPETSLQGPGRIILGSDWPMASLDPRVHIKTLAEATASAGRDAADPHVSLSAAIDAYTSAAAYASFDDQRKGTLSRGMLADIVILSADIFAAPPARLLDAVVETTIFDGKIVYTRDSKTTN